MARTSPLRMLTLLSALVGARAGLWCGPGTRIVDKTGQGLPEIPAGAFTNCTRLQKLILESNNFVSISRENFTDDLTSLTELSLYGNKLTIIGIGSFDKLPSLTHLYLGNNKLTSIIPVNAFDGLQRLKVLSLNANQLATIPTTLFSSLPSLTQLYLDSNKLRSFPLYSFQGLTKLQGLYLGQNRLTSIPTDPNGSFRAFKDLTSLGTLDLQANKLTSIPDRSFTGLTKLTRLNLGNNLLASYGGASNSDGVRAAIIAESRNQTSLQLTWDPQRPTPTISPTASRRPRNPRCNGQPGQGIYCHTDSRTRAPNTRSRTRKA